ncbi:hypothetical protein FRX31_035226 [Thalictrum thalictroides]|uniref:Uncharacterized protein n=1 Tax=Thalictrum thalictroides TaxID=46969 RepID=A0A7J6URM6_THATH|nr:hypothetical protein FRX31_035226 [Thalictrum thalictroides]
MAKNLSSIFFSLFIIFLVVDSSLAVRPISTTLLNNEMKAIIEMVSTDDGVAMSIPSNEAVGRDGKALFGCEGCPTKCCLHVLITYCCP